MKIRVSILLLFLSYHAGAQNYPPPADYSTEFKAFQEADLESPPPSGVILFTGSSSIRMWKDLETSFRKEKIINRGFGGSNMHELNYYADSLIFKYMPSKIFIYEGDNDIPQGVSIENILTVTKELTGKIRDHFRDIPVYFISAKPSPSRWQYQDQYEEWNQTLKAFCDKHENVFYVDIWDVMLNKKGRPEPTIFVADSLHMNEKGYKIWRKELKSYVKD